VGCTCECSDCGPSGKCQAAWKSSTDEEKEDDDKVKAEDPKVEEPEAEKELTVEELEAEAAKLQERTIAIKKMIGTRPHVPRTSP
jgi:hypothetical protein